MNKLVNNPQFSKWGVSPFCWYTILSSGFFGLIILAVLLYLNIGFRRNYIKTKANIVNEECGERYYNQGAKEMVRNCTLDIEFNDQKGKIRNTTIHSPFNYKSNSKLIEINYDPINPEGTAGTPFPMIFINGILILFLVLLFGNAIFFYIFRKSGWLCVASGARMVFGKK